MEISSLDDIQKLKGKDLGEILKSNSKSTNGIRADLVSKVYALLMWHVLPSSSGENRELFTDVQGLEQNQSDLKYENKTYVKVNVLPSMKKTPYRAVLEFSPTCDVLRAKWTSGLDLRGKGKCNHIGGGLFAIEDFIRGRFQNNPRPLTSTSRLLVWVVPRNRRVAAKPIDKVLIRKIRFGKNMRT